MACWADLFTSTNGKYECMGRGAVYSQERWRHSGARNRIRERSFFAGSRTTPTPKPLNRSNIN
jgi:hypothetical protein